MAAIFGPHKNPSHELGPTRIIVRDGQCTQGGETELKSENVIDRKTGAALHPRKVERVVEGSEFSLRIGIQVWDLDANSKHNGKTGGDALVEFVTAADAQPAQAVNDARDFLVVDLLHRQFLSRSLKY